MSMLPSEMIEPVIDRHASNADAVIAHVGEIGQLQPTRRMLLPEDHVSRSPVERPPAADMPLQGAADTDADLGIAASDLVENGHWPQAGFALQQRHHLTVPNRNQRISPSPAPRRFLLRRQSRILFDTIGAGSTEPGLGRGDGRRLGLAKTHVQPHLAISDVAAGQAVVPHRHEETASYPAGCDRQKTRP